MSPERQFRGHASHSGSKASSVGETRSPPGAARHENRTANTPFKSRIAARQSLFWLSGGRPRPMFGGWFRTGNVAARPGRPGRETTASQACNERTSILMKKATALVFALLSGATLLAADHTNDSIVTWRNIVGVISAPGVDNPVAVVTDDRQNVVSQIHSGTLPWVARSGAAAVDLRTGAVEFNVRGFVLIGGNASGTAGPINQVVGTLVCNPGSRATNQPQVVLDTPPVALSGAGNATFSGELTGDPPSPCDSPLFLIRIGPAFGAFAGRWLATGVDRVAGRDYGFGNRHDFRY